MSCDEIMLEQISKAFLFDIPSSIYLWLGCNSESKRTDTEGYRYVLPFQCAQFIGFSANKNKLADIISPKMDLIKYLTQRVPNLRGKFLS